MSALHELCLGRGRFIAREDAVEHRLSVDPLAMFRAMRAAGAPILTRNGQLPVTASELFALLGPTTLSRLLSAPVQSANSPRRLARLWLHSLATAVATRSLAELTDPPLAVDPDHAFALGLVHDVSLWSELASACGNDRRPPIGPLEFCRMWRLPERVELVWLVTHCGTSEVKTGEALARMILAGEALAILGGFPHPGGESGEVENDLLASLGASRIKRVLDQLRAGMDTRFKQADLELGDIERLAVSGEAPQFGTTAESLAVLDSAPPFEDGILGLVELPSDIALRQILRRLVDTCCSTLHCDRAFFLQWVGKGKSILIRVKQDRSSEPVGDRKVAPTSLEIETIAETAGSGHPELLMRKCDSRYGLLDHLGTDALLVVPVFGSSMLHGFLLLDRAYSATPEVLELEKSKALALAKVCGQNLTSLMLQRREQRSQRDAFTDVLTGLMNRRAAMTQLEREMNRVRRHNLPMSILMMDLDRFKEWNDTYGHLTGDKILAKIGVLLRSTLRGSDTAARIGGEEFLIIQPETTIEESSLVAARIYKAVETAGKELGIPFTISVGLTDLRDDDTIEDVFQRADKALYASKQYGRNRFSIDSQWE